MDSIKLEMGEDEIHVMSLARMFCPHIESCVIDTHKEKKRMESRIIK